MSKKRSKKPLSESSVKTVEEVHSFYKKENVLLELIEENKVDLALHFLSSLPINVQGALHHVRFPAFQTLSWAFERKQTEVVRKLLEIALEIYKQDIFAKVDGVSNYKERGDYIKAVIDSVRHYGIFEKASKDGDTETLLQILDIIQQLYYQHPDTQHIRRDREYIIKALPKNFALKVFGRACEKGHVEVVKKLLEMAPQIDEVYAEVFKRACEKRQSTVVKEVLIAAQIDEVYAGEELKADFEKDFKEIKSRFELGRGEAPARVDMEIESAAAAYPSSRGGMSLLVAAASAATSGPAAASGPASASLDMSRNKSKRSNGDRQAPFKRAKSDHDQEATTAVVVAPVVADSAPMLELKKVFEHPELLLNMQVQKHNHTLEIARQAMVRIVRDILLSKDSGSKMAMQDQTSEPLADEEKSLVLKTASEEQQTASMVVVRQVIAHHYNYNAIAKGIEEDMSPNTIFDRPSKMARAKKLTLPFVYEGLIIDSENPDKGKHLEYVDALMEATRVIVNTANISWFVDLNEDLKKLEAIATQASVAPPQANFVTNAQASPTKEKERDFGRT